MEDKQNLTEDLEKVKKFSKAISDIKQEIRKDVVGQEEIVDSVITAIIAGGNVLLEGVPGVGKTRLVRSFSKALSLPFSRIQFTPDLMPSDVTGTNVIEKDAEGNVVCVHADYLPETKSGTAGADSVKTKAAIHWLDAKTAVPAQFRMYDRLFTVPQPDSAEDFLTVLNRDSKFVSQGFVEPNVAAAAPETRYQFERIGYFVTDIKDHSAEHPVLNLAVGLRDSWGKNAR